MLMFRSMRSPSMVSRAVALRQESCSAGVAAHLTKPVHAGSMVANREERRWAARVERREARTERLKKDLSDV